MSGTASSKVRLRPYQEEAIASVLEAEERGQRRNMVVLPTGAGKTVVFGALTARTPGRTLILAHRDELIQQTVRKLGDVEPDLLLETGVVKAEANQTDSRIVVASVQTLARESRREFLRSGTPFERVIVDEAHHSSAATYMDVLKEAGALDPLGLRHGNGPSLLGVTATAVRGDSARMDHIFEGIVFEKNILWGINEGYLCDLRGREVLLELDFDKLRTSHGDFSDGELGTEMERVKAPELIVKSFLEHAAHRRTIVFTPTVVFAIATHGEFVQHGVSCEYVTGATPGDERREMLRRFHSGETQVMVNCGVLTEGFDEPAVSCIIVARPTRSQALYIQMVGRGARPYPNKEDCLILDVSGASRRHSLIQLPTLFGVEPALMKDAVRTAAESVAEQQARAALAVMPYQRGKLHSREVDLFRRTALHWIVNGDRMILSGNAVQYIIDPVNAPQPNPEDRLYRLRLLDGGKGGAPDRLTLMYGVHLQVAIGTAEDAVRAQGKASYAEKDARWRKGPATDRQKETLAKRRHPVHPGMTAGEASDLISVLMTR